VMQADEASKLKYDSTGKFERGKSTSRLTRTDSLSWKEKSWVIGIQKGSVSKSYDWNLLKKKGIINDLVGTTPVVIVLSSDGESFAAFERPSESDIFSIRDDTLHTNSGAYDFTGRSIHEEGKNLVRVKVYQEFWQSWRTFHPETQQYH
jgi:hypothetical protein